MSITRILLACLFLIAALTFVLCMRGLGVAIDQGNYWMAGQCAALVVITPGVALKCSLEMLK